jgi:hypothetical protein
MWTTEPSADRRFRQAATSCSQHGNGQHGNGQHGTGQDGTGTISVTGGLRKAGSSPPSPPTNRIHV